MVSVGPWQPLRITQYIRILARFVVEQDARRFERRCAKHNDSDVLLVISLRDLIDDADSTRLAGVRIDHDLAHDGVRAQSHFAGFRGGGKRRAGAAVIRVGRAAAVESTTKKRRARRKIRKKPSCSSFLR